MKLNIDYNNSLTNLACSILKYFECDYTHNTLKIVDDYLEEYKPKNVILMLCDGMGYNILNRTLDKDDFLVKNGVGYITSVFPATTTACTTSVTTGLNPSEHCWLGWENYVKELDQVVIMYFNKIKDTDIHINKKCKDIFNYETIIDKINKKDNFKASIISCFESEFYDKYDNMFPLIKSKLNKSDKNYIYAYYKDPDELMHEYGTDTSESINEIKNINKKIEEFSNTLTDTVLIVIADHGHTNIDYIYLEDYEEIFNMLKRTTSCDARSAMMTVKDEYINVFKDTFNKYFSNYFDLLTKEEIINTSLFGDGIPNKLFDSCLGDFIAIAKDKYAIKYKRVPGKTPMKSTHAGNTLDETLVPLIMIHR